MVNGGTLVQPQVVVAGIGDEVARPGRAGAEERISPALSWELARGLMTPRRHRRCRSTRDRTLDPGLPVGGKTGTAQIWDASLNGGKGGWMTDKSTTTRSYGWIGRTVPEVVVAVRIDEGTPSVVRVGRIELPVMSFELFRRIATDAMNLLDPPSPGPPAPISPGMASGCGSPSRLCDTGRVSGGGPAHARLAPMTDVPPPRPAVQHRPSRPSWRGVTGGALLARSRPPDPRRSRGLPPRPSRAHVRGAAGRADRRPSLPGRRRGRRRRGLLVATSAAATTSAALGRRDRDPVPDALAALQAAAAAWRLRFDPLIVGVTGSIAKTSTKEAVAAVARAAPRTLRSEGNQNNEIGLPLTLLRLGPEHEAAVLEMGMYVGGEIADLARIARPSIGVVTAVRGVHLSRIGTLDAVEAAKRELVEALPADGTAVLNADDPRVRAMAGRTGRPRDHLRLRGRTPTSAPTASPRPASRGCASASAPMANGARSPSRSSADTPSTTRWRPSPSAGPPGWTWTASSRDWPAAGGRPIAAS